MTTPGEPPRAGGGEGPEPLSEEEIRGLLGEDGPVVGGEPGASGRASAWEVADGVHQVLVVARDDDEGRMVRAALGGLGAGVDWVRNPFAALDQLRRKQYAAVVSNFEMWADQGSLLFQRLAQRGSRTRVVFLCPGAESVERAREAGADAALRRPLDATGLEAIFALLKLPEPRPEPDPPAFPESRFPESAPKRAAEPRPVARPPERAHELGWLRFFFEARKAMRRLQPGRARLEAILETLEREVGAVGGIAVAGPGGWWIRIRPGSPAILRHLAVVLGDPGGEGLTGGRLPDLDLRFSAGGFPGALAVFLPIPGGGLGDESASGRPAGERGPAGVVPEKFQEELSALLVEAGAMLPPEPVNRKQETEN